MEQETTDAALVQKLRELIEASPFPAERHRKLWARLQRSGLKASRERIRRLLREHHLLPQYGNIRTSRPNEMWGIDSVKVRTADGHWSFVLYAVDHCTGECLGIEVVREETVDAWLYLLLCIVLRVFGTLASEAARGLKLRCDNFPQFREARFRTDLGRLGIQITHSFRLRPEGNGIAERFARTLRENRLAVMNFADPGELRREMFAFRALYNEKYLLARWGYKTPEEVRAQFPDAPKTRTNGANLQLIQGGKPSPRVNLQALVAAFGLSLAEKLLPSTHQPVPPGDTRNGSGT